MESKNTLNLTVTLLLSKSPPVCSPTEQARTQQTLLEPLDRVRTTGGFSEPSHLFSKKLTISSEFLSLHWIRYIPVLWIQWNLDIINPQQSFARSDLSSVHVFSYVVIFFPNDLIQKPPQWMRKTPTKLTNNSWTIRTYRKSYFYRLPWSSAATWAGALSCCTRSATSGHPCWRSR